MEAFIQKIIVDYPRYIREEALFERHLEARENRDMRYALTMLKIKIGVVESWFTLLDADERLAFRQTLQADQNEPAAIRSAAIVWMRRLSKEAQTPWQIRERAIAKIAAFASSHKETMHAIFYGS